MAAANTNLLLLKVITRLFKKILKKESERVVWGKTGVAFPASNKSERSHLCS